MDLGSTAPGPSGDPYRLWLCRADDDTESSDTILSRAAGLGPGVIATLPLHISWMERKRSQEHLIAAIGEAGVPIAFIFEHASDPLAKKASLFGFVNVLRTVRVPTIVLSCDVSALGAMAFGAHTVAIGTRSGLRHLYPPRPAVLHRTTWKVPSFCFPGLHESWQDCAGRCGES